MDSHVKTNSNAIISFVLGILTFLIPFIGFIFGIIGIILSVKATKQMKETNEGGKGLAIAGLICSIIGLVLQLLVILGFVAFSTMLIHAATL